MRKWWSRLRAALLLGMVSAFVISRLLAAGPMLSDVQTVPIVNKTITLQLVLYPASTTGEQMSKICGLYPQPHERVNGCHIYHLVGDKHVIHARSPEDWCDIRKLKTLGHELMHAAGADHEGLVQVYTEVGKSCSGTELRW